MQDITRHKVSARYAYLLIVMVTLILTWSVDVNQVIAYASRAFALFYTLQCLVAFVVTWQNRQLNRRRGA